MPRFVSPWRVVVAGLPLLLTVQAELVSYEGADYQPAASLSAANGGIGWTGSWSGNNDIEDGGLTYPGLAVVGNRITTDGNNVVSFRSLATSGVAHLLDPNGKFGKEGTELWLSFLMRREAATATATYGGLSLFDGATQELLLGTPINQPVWGATVWDLNPPVSPSGVNIVNGATVLFVVRLNFGVSGAQDRVRVWLNPPLPFAAASPAMDRTGADLHFDRIRVVSGETATRHSFDEIRMGETAADVLPTLVSPPTISITDVTVNEPANGEATATLFVSLSQAHDQPVSVNFATADGEAAAPSDYDSADGTLTFTPGETSKPVLVVIRSDAITDELDEEFSVNLSGPAGGTLGDSSASVLILQVREALLREAVPLSTRWSHTAALRRDRSLWIWGYNYLGGAPFEFAAPTRVGEDNDWVTVAAGLSRTFALKADGSLWAWGESLLGDGTSLPQTAPKRIGVDTDWVAVSAGSSHTLALKADGSLWAWGFNGQNQLGDGTTENRLAPRRIGQRTDWWAVRACGHYSLALKRDGSLWAWGLNLFGESGLPPSNVPVSAPARVGAETGWRDVRSQDGHTVALKWDGSLWTWGQGRLLNGSETAWLGVTRVGADSDWVEIAVGYRHSLARKADGTVWGWGINSFGELTDGVGFTHFAPTQLSPDADWSALAAGFGTTVLLKENGQLWTTGSNLGGESGLGFTFKRILEPQQIGRAADWSSFSSGFRFSIALKPDGTFWSWGVNTFGQLAAGLVPTYTANAPAQVGADQDWVFATAGPSKSILIKRNGSLWEAGRGDFLTVDDRLMPVRIGAENDWRTAASGGESHGPHTHAIKTDGSLGSWGRNMLSELGIPSVPAAGTLTPTRVGADNDWQSVVAGREYGLALKQDKSLWGWGWNGDGQLGLGDVQLVSAPLRIGQDNDWQFVDGAADHTLALKTDGTLWAWGANSEGQLGLGVTGNQRAPVRVGLDSNWKSVAAGDLFSAAVKTDGSLWAWGVGGLLGVGDTQPRLAPTRVGADSDWSAVACGHQITLAQKTDGSLWTWGREDEGLIGLAKLRRIGADGVWGIDSASPPGVTLAVELAGEQIQMRFATAIGATYHLEWKSSLTDADWRPLESVAGDGEPKTLADGIAPDGRFYRARVSVP